MSYGTPPPPGDDRPDPTQNPDDHPAGGYGSPPPPPPQYGSGPAQNPAQPTQPTQPGYGTPPPPPPAPGYGQPPAPGGYGQAPPPPAYEQPGYGAAPAYTGPYEQGGAAGSVGTLAQWPQRALGGLIDFIALAIPGWILYAIGGPKVDSTTGLATGPNAIYYLGVLYFLALSIYNRWYRGGTTGQTIGRGVAGVKLVKESTGQPIGMGMAFVRDIAHIVDSIICYVGWLFPLWDNKRQTLADKIVSTVVVTAPKG
jgi:uncharacterized RDD family membrane protein YckC